MNPRFQTGPHRGRRGFTLVEMSTALGLMLTLATALVAMLQQHVTFMGIVQTQSFLADEAPKIGNVLGRIFNQADHYFVYPSRDSALTGGTPVLVDGQAVRLFFKAADQTTSERLIAVNTGASGAELRFYNRQPDGSLNSWVICNRLQGATFSADEGILTVTLRGPSGEEVTYCGGGQ